ncbi:MAG TPA: arginase family protein, partial [Ktedonobacterales bacterium]|nr:arginase family protein [Ktedonobacterales bacterium]
MRIALLDAPMGIGAGHIGTHLGPAAILAAGLTQRLHTLGHTIDPHISLDLPGLSSGPVGDLRLKYADAIIAGAEQIARTIAAIPPDTTVVTLGGDHSIGLGTVTGAAMRHNRQPLGVLWVDTHGDFNTSETSPSGNIHGMPLSALAGVGDPRLTQIGGF